MTDDQKLDQRGKRVFLVAAFTARTSGRQVGANRRHSSASAMAGVTGPISGIAEQVVAVIGIDGDRQRFEWVGDGPADSVSNPALITPIPVGEAIPSPWHPDDAGVVTGLVPLGESQLGAGSVDDDVDHLLAELARSREERPAERTTAPRHEAG